MGSSEGSSSRALSDHLLSAAALGGYQSQNPLLKLLREYLGRALGDRTTQNYFELHTARAWRTLAQMYRDSPPAPEGQLAIHVGVDLLPDLVAVHARCLVPELLLPDPD